MVDDFDDLHLPCTVHRLTHFVVIHQYDAGPDRAQEVGFRKHTDQLVVLSDDGVKGGHLFENPALDHAQGVGFTKGIGHRICDVPDTCRRTDDPRCGRSVIRTDDQTDPFVRGAFNDVLFHLQITRDHQKPDTKLNALLLDIPAVSNYHNA
ncbi:MAG: hypothetical protein BWY82_00839 [Verrucomicrobia bacterium ADurb.Bin474]|nr:MAG: hypothetical protein BWY82_00839 [Verrucomicrobia bacterium ADurb.Bin474]